jgi:formamidopyrimidine-DNA glycosylase
MPELPEVETLCRQLNTVLPGKKILAIEVLDDRLAPTPDLIGATVQAVARRGKFIRIATGEARSGPGGSATGAAGAPPAGVTAMLHLRMTGRLLWQPQTQPPSLPLPRYTRLVLSFADGRLVLIDPRRFATFCQAAAVAAPALLANPLEGLPAARLRAIAGSRRLPVKSLLMDQRLVAGIGNIYACEILHKAGVDPHRPAGSLKPAEWRRVGKASAEVLERAVDCRGTSISDWRDLFGAAGTNQHHLEVYSRQGEPCRRCGGRIERTTLGGRGTWFCPSCQK